MSFSSTISKLRENAKLTQQDVADGIRVAKPTYVKIESGDREPKLDEIRALSEFYQIDTVSLIDGIDHVSEPTPTYRPTSIDEKPRPDVKLRTDKLRQVLLYIAEKAGAKPNVGATVINKLLYFIDFDYYELYGESITGLKYIRNHYGPTAHLSTISSVVDSMERDGDMEVAETEYFKHKQKKYLPRKHADLSLLNARELAHIDWELDRLADKKANELSDMSHLDMPWLATKPGQAIEYQLAMYRTAVTSVRGSDDVEL
ncbi:MAG: type II toxin-antitoxin system antitoxin SocA domain-containing protein [Candidatus Saccharimonadales bacterium]